MSIGNKAIGNIPPRNVLEKDAEFTELKNPDQAIEEMKAYASQKNFVCIPGREAMKNGNVHIELLESERAGLAERIGNALTPMLNDDVPATIIVDTLQPVNHEAAYLQTWLLHTETKIALAKLFQKDGISEEQKNSIIQECNTKNLAVRPSLQFIDQNSQNDELVMTGMGPQYPDGFPRHLPHYGIVFLKNSVFMEQMQPMIDKRKEAIEKKSGKRPGGMVERVNTSLFTDNNPYLFSYAGLSPWFIPGCIEQMHPSMKKTLVMFIKTLRIAAGVETITPKMRGEIDALMQEDTKGESKEFHLDLKEVEVALRYLATAQRKAVSGV